MRFSSSVFLALPLATFAAEEGAFDQYKAQFQNFLGSFGAKQAADQEKADEIRKEQYTVEEVPVEGSALASLTLENWHDTLYGSLPEGATAPEEWWLFVTGGNKTCRGYCTKAEAAFNETAATFGAMAETETPNMATLNCEEEPILCNAWSCSPGALWIIDMLPPPSDVEIYGTRLNLSSVTTEDIQAYLDPAARGKFKRSETIFHPFNGQIAKLGLSVPVGYIVYYTSMVPSWVFMFGISAISRTMMTNRMRGNEERRAAQAAPAPAAN